jgi:hypothetical protein
VNVGVIVRVGVGVSVGVGTPKVAVSRACSNMAVCLIGTAGSGVAGGVQAAIAIIKAALNKTKRTFFGEKNIRYFTSMIWI